MPGGNVVNAGAHDKCLRHVARLRQRPEVLPAQVTRERLSKFVPVGITVLALTAVPTAMNSAESCPFVEIDVEADPTTPSAPSWSASSSMRFIASSRRCTSPP